MKKPTVTIFIPAYNEERNIANIINDIMLQNKKCFTLDQILVISDGSTDNTNSIVRSISNRKLKYLNNTRRLGKVPRINQAFKITESDVMVQIDADVRMKNTQTINNLVKQFDKVSKIGIVCGDHRPLKPVTFIERISYFGTMVWARTLNKLGDRAIAYRCVGHIRAFSRSFYKSIKMPSKVGSTEDTYSFYFAISNNFAVTFAPLSIVEHRLPSTAGDYLKQMVRFLNERKTLVDSFGENIVMHYETITIQLKLIAFFEEAMQTPLIVACAYAVMQTLSYILPKNTPKNGIWEVSQSTKLS